MTQCEINQCLHDHIALIAFREFGNKILNFHCTISSINESSSHDLISDRPGVYVYRIQNRVYRVGRSLKNARTRALQHIRDNTGPGMKKLKNASQAELILFTIPKDAPIHWLVALEIFLEATLSPIFRSKRRA